EGRLWRLVDDRQENQARTWLGQLADVFGDRLSIEVAHHLLPGDTRRIHRLARLSDQIGIPLVATGDVRYAVPQDYRRYDLLTCVREGITIFDAHPARPKNA